MPFYFRLGKRSQQYNVANKDLFVIPIELLTNECIECTLFSTSIGQECLNNVCQKIGLQQPEYFGLLFKSRKNVDQWVDLTKPLKKQLDKYSIEIRLYLRLQFFVPNFKFLSDEISRYHYFCAMKGLVIDGRIACSRDDAILLASFSLQAEFGDYSPERHTVEYLNNFALFPKSMVTSKLVRDVLVECAINAYRNLQGVPTNVAEIYYISEAQQRDGYGQEGFPARDLDIGQDVCLGVCIRGIFVINTDANTVELFKWNDIANLMHNKKIFTIQRNLENYRKSYSTFDGDYASCIWRACVEQHKYFLKGIQTATENEQVNDHLIGNSSVGHVTQIGQFSMADNFAKKPFNAIDNTDSYSQVRHVNSLYETINKSAVSSSSPFTIGGLDLSNAQEYTINGYHDNKIDYSILKKRSSTEPIDLHHITLDCANGGGSKLNSDLKSDINGFTYSQMMQAKARSNASSPLTKSSLNTPIYENQLNVSNDLTFDQRKKLLPPYKSPPDYEAFIKRKYSAMTTLSQSLSSIPSRLASHNHVNSSSSSSSLVNAFLNAASLTNATKNVISSSTTSVPFLLQQRQPIFLSNVYKNYADLSNLDIEKQASALSKVNYRGSLPPTESNVNGSAHHIVFNQLHSQKQQMQSSGMFTASSPELNNLILFQKRNAHAKVDHSKLNGTVKHLENGDSNLKKRSQLPHYFTSVPDLTFRASHPHGNNSGPETGPDNKKFTSQNRTKSSLSNFGAKNLKILRSQNNTGSEPNLFNEFVTNSNCYNLQRSKLQVEHFNVLSQKRSNSINMMEQPQAQRHLFSYSNKIDESPELTGSKPYANIASPRSAKPSLSSHPNIYSPLHQNKHTKAEHVIYANLNSLQSSIAANASNTAIAPEQPSKLSEPPRRSVLPQVNLASSSTSPIHIHASNYNQASHNLQTVHETNVQSQGSQFRNEPKIEPTNDGLTANVSLNSEPLNIPKNSRIIVFDKSFEDQDFTREFELLPRMNPTAKFTTASLSDNILKNRFRDILPYEENRVKLTPSKDNKHGYINASHVFMSFGLMKQHYIAAQGPLPTTTLDFWQMVFEQSISLIVMVTNFTESGAQKCYTYLPLSNEPTKNTIRFGDYEIVCNYTSVSLTYTTSFLTLNYNGQKRNVTHLRYTDWNDHSIPGDLHGFLSFLSEMDAIHRRSTRDGSGFGKKRSPNQAPVPILVHCSAGAGRSGVVILCDALLKCLDHNFSQPIDIPRALIQLRFQRMISVQHCEQFRFVCQVLSQYLSDSRLI